jgi:hypothetical protein
MKLNELKWTNSYFGVSHLGELDHTNVRVTVSEYSNHTVLKCFPRDFATPIKSEHETARLAKAAGVAWMKENFSEK